MLVRNTENIPLRFDRALPAELAGQLVLASSAAGPVRLLDVATVMSAPARSDRLDGQSLRRRREAPTETIDPEIASVG